MSSNPHLKAFVRYDGSNRPVAGSLILRVKKPKVGKWKEVYSHNVIPPTSSTTTTTSTTSNITTTTTTTTP